MNIVIPSGGNFEFSAVFTNEDGAPINLTGAKVCLALKWNVADSDTVVFKMVDSHVNAAAGSTKVTLTNSDTSALAGGGDSVYAQIYHVSSGGVITYCPVEEWRVSPVLSARLL